jgi:hypothetical protein
MGAVALRATLTTPRAACAAAAQLPPCEDDSGRILAGPDPSQSAAHLDVPALDRPVVVCVGGSTHRIDRACQRAEALFRAPYACATRKAAAATGPTKSASIPWVRQRGRSLAGLSHVVRSGSGPSGDGDFRNHGRAGFCGRSSVAEAASCGERLYRPEAWCPRVHGRANENVSRLRDDRG